MIRQRAANPDKMGMITSILIPGITTAITIMRPKVSGGPFPLAFS
jgi:hypothetical protein